MQPGLPYDSVKDFQPLTFAGKSPLVLIVNPANPAQSVPDMIARAKAANRAIHFGSSGIGIANHISGELLKLYAQKEKVDMVHVPYKDGGQAINDVVSGQIEVLIGGAATVAPRVRAGQVRGLALTGATRAAIMPEVPTMAESGWPQLTFDPADWTGFLAPAGTPPAIVDSLYNAISEVMRSSDARMAGSPA